MKISSLFEKNFDFSAEYKRFKKSMESTPHDYGLKAQFVKFCLLNRFTSQKSTENHIAEALALFETIENDHGFDIQCHYLVGKYYQEDKDNRKAYQIYLNAIRRFNQYVAKNPNLKSENSDSAYSISLNLMMLQSNPIDPEVEKCFKIIRKSFPLHVKRFEFENEMAKPAPDKERIKQLKEEIRQLKADEEKEISAAATEKPADIPVELKQFKKAMENKPDDYGLKAQFIKFCLLNRFTNKEITKSHIVDALALFETIKNAHGFDIECHYLVGKYYQEEKDNRKAHQIYLNAIKRFNQYAVLSPKIDSENSELVYSVALNLLNLQSDSLDPEVEKCFKIIHKPHPFDANQPELETKKDNADSAPIIMQSNEEVPRFEAGKEKRITVSASELEMLQDLSGPVPVTIQSNKTLPPFKAADEKEVTATANAKITDGPAEYKQFKKDIENKPDDYGLQTQFIKFCLLNRSTNKEINESHVAEALKFFEKIENGKDFDIECHYRVGRYYQEEKDNLKAHQIYLNAIKRFNQFAVMNHDFKSENTERAYSIALNLIILQPTPAEPEVEKYFKIIHKSYALYIKRFELEKEMSKPDRDPERIKLLKNEILRLKAEEEKVNLTSAQEEPAETSISKPKEDGDFSKKIIKDSSPIPEGIVELKVDDKKPQITPKKDGFFLSAVSDISVKGVTYMVFQNNNWEGPYTLSQLRSNSELNPNTWLCRVGTQIVIQFYEVSDLHFLV